MTDPSFDSLFGNGLAYDGRLPKDSTLVNTCNTKPINTTQGECNGHQVPTNPAPPTSLSPHQFISHGPTPEKRRNTLMSHLETPGSRFFRRQNTLTSQQSSMIFNSLQQRQRQDGISHPFLTSSLRIRKNSNATSPVLSGRNSPANLHDSVRSELKISLGNHAPNNSVLSETKAQDISHNLTSEHSSGRSSPAQSVDQFYKQTSLVEKLQQQLDEKHDLYLKMKEKHLESTIKVTHYQERLESLKNKYKSVKKSNKDMKETIFNQLQELAEARNVKDRADIATSKVQQDLQEAKENLRKACNEIQMKDSLLMKHRDYDSEKDRLISELEQSKQTTSSLRETNEQLSIEYRRVLDTLGDLESENEVLKTTNAKLKQTSQRLRDESQEELDELRVVSQRKIRELEEELEEATRENDHLEHEFLECEKKLNNMVTAQAQTASDESLVEQNRQLENECKTLKTRLHYLQSEYDAYRLDNDGEFLKKKIEDLSLENERLAQNQLFLEQAVQTHVFSDSKHKFSLRELEGHCQTLEREKAQLQIRLSSRNSELNKVICQLEKVTQELQQTQAQLQKRSKEVEKVEEEKTILWKEIGETRSKLAEVLESHERDNHTLTRLQQTDEEVERLKQRLALVVDEKDQEINRLQKRVGQYNLNLEELQKEVETARENEFTERSDARKLRRQLADCEEELVVLKKRLDEAKQAREAAENEVAKHELETLESRMSFTSPRNEEDYWMPDENYSYEDRPDCNIYGTLPRKLRNFVRNQSQANRQDDLLSQVDAALSGRSSLRIRPAITRSTFVRTYSTRERKRSEEPYQRSQPTQSKP